MRRSVNRNTTWIAASNDFGRYDYRLQQSKCTARSRSIGGDAGSQQDHALAFPHRSEAIGLARLNRETLCRSPKFAKIRRHGEG